MKKHKWLGTIAITGVCLISNLTFASPFGVGTFREDQHKVTALAAGSWVCGKCGFHITTKSGNKPSGGTCFKNNNGPHDWEEGN